MAVARMALAATKLLPALSQVAAMEFAKTLAGVIEQGEREGVDSLATCSRRCTQADVAESMSKAWRGEVGE